MRLFDPGGNEKSSSGHGFVGGPSIGAGDVSWETASMSGLAALVVDVDGALAGTESAHMKAFNQTFRADGLARHRDRKLYIRRLSVTGGREHRQHNLRTCRTLCPMLLSTNSQVDLDSLRWLHERH